MLKKTILILTIVAVNCFANSIIATITNKTNQEVSLQSQTSTATIGENKISSNTTKDIVINFQTFATPRANITINNSNTGITQRQLLIVLNGAFNISTVVCVPISSCKPGNPLLNSDHKSFYFTLKN